MLPLGGAAAAADWLVEVERVGATGAFVAVAPSVISISSGPAAPLVAVTGPVRKWKGDLLRGQGGRRRLGSTNGSNSNHTHTHLHTVELLEFWEID